MFVCVSGTILVRASRGKCILFCYEGSCGKNAGAGLLDEDERHMAVGCFIQ